MAEDCRQRPRASLPNEAPTVLLDGLRTFSLREHLVPALDLLQALRPVATGLRAAPSAVPGVDTWAGTRRAFAPLLRDDVQML